MKILVTGATGRIGRHVTLELLNMGHEVRALTRDPERARLPAGVEVVAGDLGAPDSLESALSGIDGIHVINFDGATLAHLAHPEELVARIAAAGVQRVTTFRGEEPGQLEQLLEQSTLSWTDLFIPVEFMTNTLDWSQSIQEQGVVRAFGPPLSAMIHEADVGAVAAIALTREEHSGKTYTLTGPEALAPLDTVRIISEVIGRPIRYEELMEDEVREKWRALGYADPMIDFLANWYRDPPANAYTVQPTVEQILGRPPRRFAEWIAEHKDAFLSTT